MNEGRAVCVLCKRAIDVRDSGRIEINGGPAYRQLCPSCGWFIAEPPAIAILDGAVKDGVRTREDIVQHFAQIIGIENRESNPAVITSDAAQAYCYSQAFTMADFVYARLMNGPLRKMQEDMSGLKSDVSYLKEEMSGLHRKFDDQHEWFTTLSQRVDDLEDR